MSKYIIYEFSAKPVSFPERNRAAMSNTSNHRPFNCNNNDNGCSVIFFTGSLPLENGTFAHDVMAAILLFQNNETATRWVYQANTMGVELLPIS